MNVTRKITHLSQQMPIMYQGAHSFLIWRDNITNKNILKAPVGIQNTTPSLMKATRLLTENHLCVSLDLSALQNQTQCLI